MITKNTYSSLANQNLGGNSGAFRFRQWGGTEDDIIAANPTTNFKHQMTKVLLVPSINSDTSSANGAKNGVLFGDNATPARYEDTKLLGNLFTNGSVSYAQSVNETEDGKYVELTTVYTITNTGDSDFTVAEVGIVSGGNYANFSRTYLMDRTVLDEPVTIPAGGVGVVTYTIRLNYPTA